MKKLSPASLPIPRTALRNGAHAPLRIAVPHIYLIRLRTSAFQIPLPLPLLVCCSPPLPCSLLLSPALPSSPLLSFPSMKKLSPASLPTPRAALRNGAMRHCVLPSSIYTRFGCEQVRFEFRFLFWCVTLLPVPSLSSLLLFFCSLSSFSFVPTPPFLFCFVFTQFFFLRTGKKEGFEILCLWENTLGF
jgi:hypothetical protein